MKSLTLILIYIGTLVFLYIILSLIGLLWMQWSEIMAENGWKVCYTLFIGWWVALFPTVEYYEKNKKHLKSVFG